MSWKRDVWRVQKTFTLPQVIIQPRRAIVPKLTWKAPKRHPKDYCPLAGGPYQVACRLVGEGTAPDPYTPISLISRRNPKLQIPQEARLSGLGALGRCRRLRVFWPTGGRRYPRPWPLELGCGVYPEAATAAGNPDNAPAPKSQKRRCRDHCPLRMGIT